MAVISPELQARATEAWVACRVPRAACQENVGGGSAPRGAQRPRPQPRRGRLSGTLLQRLHGVASSTKFKGLAPADVHAELHRCACVFFGRDHLVDLSEAQGYLLYRWLKGERNIEPSPKRAAKLAALEQALGLAGDDVRRQVMAAATEKFGAEGLDDCGIGRLSALLAIANYYQRKGVK